MIKAKCMSQLVDHHPLLLLPPKRRDVNLCSRPSFVTNETRVVPIGQIASEVNEFFLIRAWNETDLRAGIDPSLDAAFHNGLLFRRQLRYVIRYNAARPWLRPCCMRIYVSGQIRGLQPHCQQKRRRERAQDHPDSPETVVKLRAKGMRSLFSTACRGLVQREIRLMRILRLRPRSINVLL